MPVFDARLMFISSGNLTAAGGTYPSTGIKTFGTPNKGAAVLINIPSFPGTRAKLTMNVQVSKDNSTFVTVASYHGGVQSFVSGTAKQFVIPFAQPADKPYVKLNLAVATATTGQSFGAVKAGIVERVGADWERLGYTIG